MDERLQQRLAIFRGMDDVPPGVVDAVADELTLLEADHRVDDESAGMLVSHLVAALGRMVRGDPDIEGPGAEIYAEVVTDAPEAVDRAAAVSERVRTKLGVPLSEVERQYLAFHLATLALTAATSAPAVPPKPQPPSHTPEERS